MSKPPNLREGFLMMNRDCYNCKEKSSQSKEQWLGKKISCNLYNVETNEYQVCDDFGRKE